MPDARSFLTDKGHTVIQNSNSMSALVPWKMAGAQTTLAEPPHE